ncbi:MAG: hypothetical protein Tsb0018_07330 [Opitutales bacterium]|tara:strand:- start:651 stop:1793 length:1143 start_codon:yes stop_codon:yes gene_type:complete
MHTIIRITLVSALVGLSFIIGPEAQASSRFKRLLQKVEKEAKNFAHSIETKGKNFGEKVEYEYKKIVKRDLPDCPLELVQEAATYAKIVEANTLQDASEINVPNFSILNIFKTTEISPEDLEAIDEQLEPFAIDNLLLVHSERNELLKTLQTIAHDSPEVFLQYFFNETNHDTGRVVSLEDRIEDNTPNLKLALEGFGVRARIFKNNHEPCLILAFRGTDYDIFNNTDRMLQNISTNIWQGGGGCSLAYEFAYLITYALMHAFPEDTIECTGHSLGGGLAAFSGAALRLKAFCFNDPNLADCSLDRIFLENPEAVHNHFDPPIVHVHIEGELLNRATPWLPGKKLGYQCDIPRQGGSSSPVKLHSSSTVAANILAFIENN